MFRAFRTLVATAILLLQLPLFAGDSNSPKSSDKMMPQTRLQVIRDLTAEHAFVRTVFPRGKKGLQLKDGKLSPDSQEVAKLVSANGFAAKPGDRVTITNVVVREKSITLEINGGAKKHEKWYKHISVGAGPVVDRPPDASVANGSLLTLAFDNYVPELTGQQLREMLAPVLDFKALSEAEAYQKTLPPKVQDAIKNHQVLVGMDRDMVIYAKGRPPRKVRDKDAQGVDYEEWIYGDPPEEVQFVRFQGPVVSRLEIMTVDGRKIVRSEKEVDLQTEVAQTGQKTEEKATKAPTLRRPGEQVEDPRGTRIGPPIYPPPAGADPNQIPDGTSPHWQESD